MRTRPLKLCSSSQVSDEVSPHRVCLATSYVGPRADDLGWADTQVRNPFSPTPHIGQLADVGIQLLNHHVYKYCSPVRQRLDILLAPCVSPCKW